MTAMGRFRTLTPAALATVSALLRSTVGPPADTSA